MIFIVLLFAFFNLITAETFCPLVNTPAQDRRTHTNSLKIMQYNIEWAFLDYYKSADCPGDGCPWKNTDMSYDHLNHVSDIINKFNPDIVNICEIEGCDELKYLMNSTTANYHTYLTKGTDTSTGQNVGMLTKIDPLTDLYSSDLTYSYPIEGSQCGYDGTGHTSISKHFITTFKWNDINVAFLSLHLLAYPDKTDRCAKREAQAKIAENIIEDYVSRGYEMFVIGDFNDYDRNIPDLNNSIPLSKTLDIIKGAESSIYNLENTLIKVKQDERYTNWWDKDGNCLSSSDELVLIDHILVSEKLYKLINNVYIYHNYDMFCSSLNSDHYPILLEIDFDL